MMKQYVKKGIVWALFAVILTVLSLLAVSYLAFRMGFSDAGLGTAVRISYGVVAVLLSVVTARLAKRRLFWWIAGSCLLYFFLIWLIGIIFYQ